MRRTHEQPIGGPVALTLVGVLAFLVWLVVIIVAGIQYDRRIGGHLELASIANQPATAIEELKLAIQGMDADGITCNQPRQCYTSVLYTEPDEDVGFWRQNIEQTLADLEALPPDADHLKVSNTLLKVRETLTTEGKDGSSINDPSGISLYPNNRAFAWWGWGSFSLACLAFCTILWRRRHSL